VGPSSVKELIKGKKAQLVFGDPIQIDAEEQIDRKTAMKMMTDELNAKFEELKEVLQPNQK
jgi:1-acyl-sn-glycerol-3-phosphate acyltransferase